MHNETMKKVDISTLKEDDEVIIMYPDDSLDASVSEAQGKTGIFLATKHQKCFVDVPIIDNVITIDAEFLYYPPQPQNQTIPILIELEKAITQLKHNWGTYPKTNKGEKLIELFIEHMSKPENQYQLPQPESALNKISQVVAFLKKQKDFVGAELVQRRFVGQQSKKDKWVPEVGDEVITDATAYSATGAYKRYNGKKGIIVDFDEKWNQFLIHGLPWPKHHLTLIKKAEKPIGNKIEFYHDLSTNEEAAVDITTKPLHTIVSRVSKFTPGQWDN